MIVFAKFWEFSMKIERLICLVLGAFNQRLQLRREDARNPSPCNGAALPLNYVVSRTIAMNNAGDLLGSECC